jgi:hypothetical protein
LAASEESVYNVITTAMRERERERESMVYDKVSIVAFDILMELGRESRRNDEFYLSVPVTAVP